jgi:transposase
MRQAGLFGLSDHLKRLSAHGDPLEELGRIIDFEAFRPTLVAALAYGDGAKGGRPPYDPVAMLKVLILAAQNNVSDARMEYLIRDRLSWLRFLGFDLGAATPDANTIRLFREKLTEAGALDALFADFDRQLKDRGYLAMGGQIVDATLVAAPKQRNTAPEKDAIKAGKTAGEIWPDAPARAAQKDTDARWTLKFTITVMPDLHAALGDYAALYEQAYGQRERVEDLIPAMLTAFLDSDRGFVRSRTKP